jgi:hypothetical protein
MSHSRSDTVGTSIASSDDNDVLAFGVDVTSVLVLGIK